MNDPAAVAATRSFFLLLCKHVSISVDITCNWTPCDLMAAPFDVTSALFDAIVHIVLSVIDSDARV